MKRTILAITTGLVTWVAIAAIGGVIIRATWSAYVAVEDSGEFTLPMQFARLGLGVIASIGAGWVTALIMRRSSNAPVILGIIFLVLFIPQHIFLWEKFPIWYHLWFLLTLVPLSYLGGKLFSMRSKPARPSP